MIIEEPAGETKTKAKELFSRISQELNWQEIRIPYGVFMGNCHKPLNIKGRKMAAH